MKTVAKQFLKRAKLFYKSGVGKAIKKIPFGMGVLIDAAINYFVFREPLGKAISISFVDIFPKFNHKEKILKNFEENGLVLLDYEITYRPMKNSELNDYELENVTKH